MKKALLIILPILVVYLFISDNKDSIDGLNTSSQNEAGSSKTYVNEDYNFSFNFPENWMISNDYKYPTVQKVASAYGIIYIDAYSVKDLVGPFLKEGSNKNTNNIYDLGSLTEYKERSLKLLRDNYPDSVFMDFGESEINGEPTYWIKYSVKNTEIIQYQLLKNDINYSIALNCPADKCNMAEPDFLESIKTFRLMDNN